LPNPRECPECGGLNVRAIESTRGRPREAGVLLIRRRRCADCGFEGDTAEFWIRGERAAAVADVLLDEAS